MRVTSKDPLVQLNEELRDLIHDYKLVGDLKEKVTTLINKAYECGRRDEALEMTFLKELGLGDDD